jgi:hypothetical protein
MLLIRTPNSVLEDPMEDLMHSGPESPGLNQLDFNPGVQEASHVGHSVLQSSNVGENMIALWFNVLI